VVAKEYCTLTIPTELLTALNSSTTELCRLYWIRRTDGVEYLYTDWPLPLSVLMPAVPFGLTVGVLKTFQPLQAPKVSALVNDTNLSVANTEWESYYLAKGISGDDIRAGRFDGAEVLLFLCVPNVAGTCWLLQSGYAGEMQDLGNELFKMGFRSIAQLLQQQVGRTVTELCPYKLGESRCGYTPSTAAGSIVSVSGTASRRDIVVQLNSPTVAQQGGNFWQYGLLETTLSTSKNRGLQGMIIASDIQSATFTRIRLFLSMPFDYVAGEPVKLLEGCANTMAACQGRNNVLNFGGFPFVPGVDALVSSSQG
jgi:uncharacterized phage protein (TIGR02218 family)